MEIRSAAITRQEYEQELSMVNRTEFWSSLNCFNCHGGLRSAEVSTIIAPKGGGKSTFIKTIIYELLTKRERIYCFLSEETSKRYVLPIFKVFSKVKSDNEVFELMDNLIIDSQLDFQKEQLSFNFLINRIEEMASTYDCRVILFDNFTTSFISSLGFEYQAKAITQFKRIAVKYNVAFLLVIHTSKGTNIYQDLIDGENVRGDATSVNMGSYNYIITTFFRCNPIRVFLTIDKARYHSSANKKVFELYYDKELEIFIEDNISSSDEIQFVINNHKRRIKEEIVI